MKTMDAKDKTVINSYLTTLRRFDQLKHPEVVELFKAYEAGGPESDKARKRLVECNLRLVVSIAKQYSDNSIPIEDLIQEGNIGLMKAVERFKWDKGFRFSTYATWWIRQAIGQHVLKRKRMIRLPAHAAVLQRKMIQAAEEYRKATGDEPTQEELTEITGASKTVAKATAHSSRSVVSLHQPISSTGEGDCLEDRIVDDRPGSDPFTNVSSKQLLLVARKVLDSLSIKDASILRLRFGLVEESTDHKRYPITQGELEGLERGEGLTDDADE